MNLAALQVEAHAIAKEKGWWDEERTFGDLIALVHSELSEALEAYRRNVPWTGIRNSDGSLEGVPYELADVVIRIADMAEWYGVDLEVYVSQHKDWDGQLAYEGLAQTFGEWIMVIHMALSDACPADEDRWVSINAVARVVALVQRMVTHYDIDLDAAIEAKMEYNRTRPYRHGGKAL